MERSTMLLMGKSTINGYVKLPEGILVGEMMLVSPWPDPTLKGALPSPCVASTRRGGGTMGNLSVEQS